MRDRKRVRTRLRVRQERVERQPLVKHVGGYPPSFAEASADLYKPPVDLATVILALLAFVALGGLVLALGE